MATQNPGIRIPPPSSAHKDVRLAIQQIVRRLGVSSTPTYGSVTLSSMTQGSVLFAGSGGLVSQDNANFAWNDSTNILTTAASTITNAAVIGSNSVVFQPNADSATFLRIKKVAGGTDVVTVDTINERLGFQTLSFTPHSTLPTAVVGLCARLTSDNRLYYAK